MAKITSWLSSSQEQRRGLKRPDESGPWDPRSTVVVTRVFLLHGRRRTVRSRGGSAALHRNPRRRRDGLKQVDEALAKNNEGGTGRLAT